MGDTPYIINVKFIGFNNNVWGCRVFGEPNQVGCIGELVKAVCLNKKIPIPAQWSDWHYIMRANSFEDVFWGPVTENTMIFPRFHVGERKHYILYVMRFPLSIPVQPIWPVDRALPTDQDPFSWRYINVANISPMEIGDYNWDAFRMLGLPT
jgi:hypothetical protein